MSAGYVSGAVALYLAKNPNASPTQVSEAIVRTGRATIVEVPGQTTNRSIYIGSDGLLGSTVPPFFHYAIVAGGNLELISGTKILAEDAKSQNANVHTNGNIYLGSRTNLVQGFG
jgi:hypothetical protein